MSGRCRACNVILTEEEMTYMYPGSVEYTDMCFRCLDLGEEGEDSFEIHEEEYDEE